MLVLTACNWHGELVSHFNVALEVLGCHGLLVPAQVVLLECTPKPQRFGTAVCMIGVDHERDGLALDGATDFAHTRDVVVDAIAELRLHHRESGLEMAHC